MVKTYRGYRINDFANKIYKLKGLCLDMIDNFPLYEFSDDDFATCEDFVRRRHHQLWYYTTRGQSNDRAKCQQCFEGKMAEICAYSTLVPHFVSLSKPDFKVYDHPNKTWDADLKCNDKRFAVKGHWIGSSYPVSWIFNKANKDSTGGKDKEVFEERVWVVFVVLHFKRRAGRVVSVNHSKDLKYLYQKPVKASLRGIKDSIYLTRLMEEDMVNGIGDLVGA